MAEQLNLKLRVAQALLGLATTLEQQGEMRKALETFRKVEGISKKIGANYELKEAYGGMAQTSAKLGDYNGAYKYFELDYLKVHGDIHGYRKSYPEEVSLRN